jgi:5'-3' exoribonuclease 1
MKCNTRFSPYERTHYYCVAISREGSTGATDVLLASDHSVGAPPELGDRVANLCANGVPFGARGTVVAIHDATEGCVEVLLDEEFIG